MSASPRVGPSRQARPLRSPHVLHGSADPEPDPHGGGPGKFRSYAPDSKFVPVDPLGHGQRFAEAAQTSFAFGPRSNLHDKSEFRTLDVSRYNEKHHNWQRIDTFQTPAGHLSDRRLERDIEDAPSICGFRADMLESLRRNIRDDVRSEVLDVAVVLKDLRKELAQVAVEVRKVQADLNWPELLRAIDSVKREVDFSEILDEVRRGDAKFAVLTEEVRRVKTEVDFSPVVEEIGKLKEVRRAKPEIDPAVITNALQKVKSDVITELRKVKNEAVIEGIAKFKRELEPRSVQAHVDFAPVLEALRQVKAELPFPAVLDEIGKSKADLQPVLARSARILEEIRKSKAEVLQQMRNKSDAPSAARPGTPKTGELQQHDRRDFQLEISEPGRSQRVDFTLHTGEVLQIPVVPR